MRSAFVGLKLIKMREIKFRVFDKGLKEYRTPQGGDYSLGVLSGKVRGKYGEEFPEMIVEQYTGLKDKKGKEIYEGDIVRWDDGSNGKAWRVAIVEINPDIQFRIVKIYCDFVQSAKEGYIFKFGKFIYTDTHNHLEIIGNIYENIILLKSVISSDA